MKEAFMKEFAVTEEYIKTIDKIKTEQGLGRAIYHDLVSTGAVELGRLTKLIGLTLSARFKFRDIKRNGWKFWKGFYINQNEYSPLENQIDNIINPVITDPQMTEKLDYNAKMLWHNLKYYHKISTKQPRYKNANTLLAQSLGYQFA